MFSQNAISSLVYFRSNSLAQLLRIALLSMTAASFAAPIPEIITPKSKIRRMREEDLPRFIEIFSDPKSLENANSQSSTPGALENTFSKIVRGMDYIENFDDVRSATHLGFAIMTSNRIVGFATFTRNPAAPYFVTTTMLEPEAWGKGIGTASRSAIHRFLFEDLQIQGLVSLISPDNPRSLQVTQNLGFQLIRSADAHAETQRQTQFFEYRLSRQRALGQSLEESKVLEPFKPSESLWETLSRSFYDRELPTPSRVPIYYRAMVSDPSARSHFGFEYLSVLAEELAFKSDDDLTDALGPVIRTLREQVKQVACDSRLAELGKAKKN